MNSDMYSVLYNARRNADRELGERTAEVDIEPASARVKDATIRSDVVHSNVILRYQAATKPTAVNK